MREIKFRAWDKKSNEMLYQDEFLSAEYIDLFVHSIWELMQFTGLLDKNGKEIWEGDIVTIPTCKTNKDGTFSIMETVYDRREVKFGESRIWWGWNIGAFNADRMEVIGNIYENEDLLK